MTTLQERLRKPPNVELLAFWAEQAADRIDADEALMQQALFAMQGADEIDVDMAIVIDKLVKRLEKVK